MHTGSSCPKNVVSARHGPATPRKALGNTLGSQLNNKCKSQLERSPFVLFLISVANGSGSVLQTASAQGRPIFMMGFWDFSYKLLQILQNPPFLRPPPPNIFRPRPADRPGWPALRPADCNTGPGSGRPPPFITGFWDFSHKLLQILSNPPLL